MDVALVERQVAIERTLRGHRLQPGHRRGPLVGRPRQKRADILRPEDRLRQQGLDGSDKRIGPVRLPEPVQLEDLAGELIPQPTTDDADITPDRRAQVHELVAVQHHAGPRLPFQDLLVMTALPDPFVMQVAASVLGDTGLIREGADVPRTGPDHQRLADVGHRHAVPVRVEVHHQFRRHLQQVQDAVLRRRGGQRAEGGVFLCQLLNRPRLVHLADLSVDASVDAFQPRVLLAQQVRVIQEPAFRHEIGSSQT